MSAAVAEHYVRDGLSEPSGADKYEYSFAPRPSKTGTAAGVGRSPKGSRLDSVTTDTSTLSISQLNTKSSAASLQPKTNRTSTSHDQAPAPPAVSAGFTNRRASTSTTRKRFSDHQLAEGLSQLGRTADGLRAAYLNLSISNTTLSTAQPVSHLVHVQSVKLIGNQLKSTSALGTLRHMTHLDVSHNQLQQVLQIAPPTGNLRTAVYSYNSVCHLNPTPGFERLASLHLDHNFLEYVAGLGPLPMLSQLNLSHNRLLSCKGLHGLGCLRELDLSHNKITSLEALRPLANLQVLVASHNCLHNVQGVDSLASLRRLDVSHNAIMELENLAPARHASLLSTLSTEANPLEKAMLSRLHMVYLLPQLTQLNGEEVDSKQKVHAANLHGADAEGLRAIRRHYFPLGELEDGGGATPPPEAGFVVSRAEEERAGPAGYARFRHVLAAARPELAQQGLIALSESMAVAARGDQLGAAWACFQWVVAHVALPGVERCRSVQAPLFPRGREEWEASLLGEVTGTWAERASHLFVQLCRGCELEAVTISGTWRHSGLLPGQRLAVHNHCWAGVKVNGRWRLLDVACGALQGPGGPFYVPPEAFIYTHCPMQAHWQLLDDPITMDAFWELPALSMSFFSHGLAMMSSQLCSVNTLTPVREGECLPAVVLTIAVPLGLSLAVHLMDSSLQPVTSSEANIVFQQPVLDDGSTPTRTGFGASEFTTRVMEVWVAMPGPGEFYLDLQAVTQLPGAMDVDVGGRKLSLKLRDVEDVLRVKVVLPPVEMHDPTDGMLVDTATPMCSLPTVHRAFLQGMQLLEPPASKILEADRTEMFRVLAPGADSVAIGHPDHGWAVLQPSSARLGLFEAQVILPRRSECQVAVRLEGTAALVPALTLALIPQQQHMVEVPQPLGPELSDVQESSQACHDFFRFLDENGDGLVTRKEMIAAFRRNRQYADHLRLPPRVRAGDGTLQKFNDAFLAINTDRSGQFNFPQFAAYYRVVRDVGSSAPVGGHAGTHRIVDMEASDGSMP